MGPAKKARGGSKNKSKGGKEKDSKPKEPQKPHITVGIVRGHVSELSEAGLQVDVMCWVLLPTRPALTAQPTDKCSDAVHLCCVTADCS